MEYIVLASSPGIATQTLLDLFNNPNGKTVFIEFAALRDAGSVTDATQISATRIVFHGEYNAELVNRIHTAHPTTKNILVFDTAEAALLQEFACHDTLPSLDSCISHWAESISQLTLLAEKNTCSSALVDYTSLTSATASLLTLLNTRLGIQFTDCSVTATNYSGIARLIAAATLINRDEAMVLYDDAKTLALTSEHITSYTDATSLIAKQQPAALNELHTLLRHLSVNNPINNLAAAAEQQQSELTIAHLANSQMREEMATLELNTSNIQREQLDELAKIKQHINHKENELAIALLQIQQLQEELGINQLSANQLREEMETLQTNMGNLQQELTSLENTRQQLDKKQSELEIALLQLNQLQEELEETLDKYCVFDRPQAECALLEKILVELPLLGLLRNQTNTSVQTN